MPGTRLVMLLLVASLVVTGCGRWGKRGGVRGVIPVDEGVIVPD